MVITKMTKENFNFLFLLSPESQFLLIPALLAADDLLASAVEQG